MDWWKWVQKATNMFKEQITILIDGIFLSGIYRELLTTFQYIFEKLYHQNGDFHIEYRNQKSFNISI